MKIWSEFRDFAFKGNVMDLAIGVIIGTAFGKIVTAFVSDLIMPLVSLILPNGEWRNTAITLREMPPDGAEGDVRLLLGDMASVLVDFLIVGLVLFAVARASNSLKKLHPHEPTNRQCPECLEKKWLTARSAAGTARKSCRLRPSLTPPHQHEHQRRR